MTISVYLPLLASVLLAPLSRPLAQRLSPRWSCSPAWELWSVRCRVGLERGPEPVAALVAAATAITAAATTLARGRPAGSSSLLLAVSAGVAFGSTSALARVLMTVDGQPHATEAMAMAGAGIVLFAPLGFLLTQSAYRAGRFAAALATITVVDPLTAAMGGVLLLHEPLPATPGQGLAVAAGGLLVTLGIAVLVRSPVHEPPPRAAAPDPAAVDPTVSASPTGSPTAAEGTR